jgi:hypothetical protein
LVGPRISSAMTSLPWRGGASTRYPAAAAASEIAMVLAGVS